MMMMMMSSSTPAYLNDLIQTAVPVRPLRSSDAQLLNVPKTRTEFARRSFSVAAPHTWNSLPLPYRGHLQMIPQDPSVHTVLTRCHQRLCIFGLYGAIQNAVIIIILSFFRSHLCSAAHGDLIAPAAERRDIDREVSLFRSHPVELTAADRAWPIGDTDWILQIPVVKSVRDSASVTA